MPDRSDEDIQAILDGAQAILRADDQLAEAVARVQSLTDAQLALAAEGFTTYGLAVSAELRQRRRGGGAHVV